MLQYRYTIREIQLLLQEPFRVTVVLQLNRVTIMDKQDYINIKSFLATYDFKTITSFPLLYKAFTEQHPFYNFKLFVRIVKALGVKSVVRREGDTKTPVRRLEYMPGEDRYLEIYIDTIKRCTACEGKGYIKVKLALTDTK